MLLTILAIVAEFELVEERLISGTGVLRVPEDKQKNRFSILYLDVVRMPSNRYANLNWNPAKGKYAFLTYLRNGYVLNHADMEFERQSYELIADITGQNLIALKCIYDSVARAIGTLSLGLGVPVGLDLNLIKGYESLNLLWDEVRIKCYADTAIQARLFKLEYDACDPDFDRPRRPPPPPPPLPRVPPRTPIGSIDEPYDDDDTTNPFPGDETEPPPPPPPPDPESCDIVLVTVRGTLNTGETVTITGVRNSPTGYQFAPISQAVVGGTPGNSYIAVIGGFSLGTFGCDGSDNREVQYSDRIFNPEVFYTSAEIVSVEIITPPT